MPLSGHTLIAAAGTAQALGDQPVNGGLAVRALADNTGLVFIGGDSGAVDAASGFELAAGQQLVFAFVGNLRRLWVDGEVGGEGVCWILLDC